MVKHYLLSPFDASVVVASKLPHLQALRRGRYRVCANPLAGMCYVASEAVYWLTEDRKTYAYYFRYGPEKDMTHWFLKDDRGQIFDVTAGQFSRETLTHCHNYATRRAFPKRPSKRTQALLDSVKRGDVFRATDY